MRVDRLNENRLALDSLWLLVFSAMSIDFLKFAALRVGAAKYKKGCSYYGK